MSEQQATYEVPGRVEIRQACRLPYADPGYEEPTPDEIRAAVKAGNLTGAQAGQLLGVGGRAIRRWIGGERDMPYSAWRLLLMHVGLALEDEHRLAADGQSDS